MYCEKCGHELPNKIYVLNSCPHCKAEFDYKPKWLITLFMAACAASVPVLTMVFVHRGMNFLLAMPLAMIIAVVVGDAIDVALYRAGITKSAGQVAEKPVLKGEKAKAAAKPKPAPSIERQLADVAAITPARDEQGNYHEARRNVKAVTTSVGAAAQVVAPSYLKLRYVEAGTEDAAAFAEVAGTIAREHLSLVLGPEEGAYVAEAFDSEKAIAGQMAAGHTCVFVEDPEAGEGADGADAGAGAHMGVIAFFPRAERGGANELYVDKFSLRADYRGHGHARDMFAYVSRKARELGCDRITLAVARTNFQAILAFEHLGFKKVREERKDIGAGHITDDLIYEYRLK